MSNECSPRPVCSTTMGIRGDIAGLLYSATFELRMLAPRMNTLNPLVAWRGGAMTDDTAVEREITVPVEPERAWELVTEPEHLEHWFAERGEPGPTPGGAGRGGAGPGRRVSGGRRRRRRTARSGRGGGRSPASSLRLVRAAGRSPL